MGPSGCGKSSLARAGVAASLQHLVWHRGKHEWWPVEFDPSLAKADLSRELVYKLADRVPELVDAPASSDDLAATLREGNLRAVRLHVQTALTRMAQRTGVAVRVLIVLDQLESLWSDRRFTPDDRVHFFSAVEALASSGQISVLATLRNDFFPHAQQFPAFLRLKGERGQYDILPPDVASLRRMILEPARLAGLRFECKEQTGRTLDEEILEEAARDPTALPMLQYALLEIYQLRDQKQRLLTFASYDELGGVEGALGKRAERIFQDLAQGGPGSLLRNPILAGLRGCCRGAGGGSPMGSYYRSHHHPCPS
jgi:hypothetical protein